ncbi:MAG TPA: YqhA family protein [bacterium]|nr:YqhA family protein [bacterium]
MHIKTFGRGLWAVRYIIIVPVVAVAAAAVGTVIVTTLEAVQLLGAVQSSLGAGGAGHADRLVPLGTVLQMVEGYLLAAILIIFALGLYELFIARIGVAGASESAPRTLVIHSVDDLKERLGRVVLLALVISWSP